MASYRPPEGAADRTARAVGLARLFVAALTLAALAAQLALGRRRESFDVVNFFSFFTVESNILAVLVLTITGITALRAGLQPERFVALRGATTLYMTITGVIYVLLLRGLEASLQTPIPWVNTVLHYVTPLALLTDWLFSPPARPVSYRRALRWLLFPAVYVAYSLVRGALVGWYPYPFLNPELQGYGAVARSGAVLLLGLTLLAVALAASTRRPQRAACG
jgi:hypothetical protein